ncbi:MAG: peptide-methionine (S)-S-oxide reductase MsrA [Crocinitomicaceae bacterium]|nr:peptide-methionine (S)-S-oxide reductase MsrA [Crocinitomicaceae bacterium]
MNNRYLIVVFLLAINLSCNSQTKTNTMDNDNKKNLETATFGAGCFWCVEAIFQDVKGVYSVKPGYSGGHVKNPSYKEVCTGTTGHAEVAQIKYDPSEVSFDKLLEIFWYTHDPTTLNKQGGDVGTQYRSAIFYHNDEQKNKAVAYKAKLEELKVYPDPIVTEITAFDVFYEAEDYHNDYYTNNQEQGYCKMVIKPKIEKFKKAFEKELK